MPTSSEPTNIGELRTHIAERINSGRLPHAVEEKIFAGYGHDEICDACGKPVRNNEVLYEVELTQKQTGSSLLAMHRWCFNLWVEESHQRRPDTGKPISEAG